MLFKFLIMIYEYKLNKKLLKKYTNLEIYFFNMRFS